QISGKSFEEVLQDHLTGCAQSVASSPEPSENMVSTQETQNETLEPDATNMSVNAPELVVVEHIVRSEAPGSQFNAPFRLRQFSGKQPCPSHEVDFDTWRHSVELILQDPSLSDLQRSRRILDSLVPPAANVVRPLSPQASPSAYLELLNSAFGTVEDGNELFPKFLNTFQDAGEKPSQYLHRLQTALTKALKRGGVVASEADRHLLRQFCRGCWDNALLADLQLGRRRDNPPSFTELLLQLRVEEDKQMSHLARLKPPTLKKTSKPPKPFAKVSEPTPSTNQAAKNRPKPWYCFQCGEDGHIVSACSNDPNPSLVAYKRNHIYTNPKNDSFPKSQPL
uniref:CCHC-type domain-containing protein n=1 Tax=Takifugu rubripes TaxID=31033 RepID=A0A674NQA0_TAKRU